MDNLLIAKEFLFVRHGQTDWNVRHLCQGQIDTELNLQGRKEALVSAKALTRINFSVIYSSHLKRAWQTAQIIQDYLNGEVNKGYSLEEVKNLQERYWGSLEGESSEKMYAFEVEESSFTQAEYQKSGVESLSMFKSRIVDGINYCLERSDFPLIVSHGRVFHSLCDLLGLPQIKQLPNGCLIHCKPCLIGWEVACL